jgi:hypothetical protein
VQLVEEESTRTVLAALRQVIQERGVFCTLYSDRASHFFETPKAIGKVDPHRVTQVGWALGELGIRMIPAYSPQARGPSERNFATWQGRLPPGIASVWDHLRGASQPVPASGIPGGVQPEIPSGGRAARQRVRDFRGQDLERIFSVQQERVVNRDNTVRIGNRVLQIEKRTYQPCPTDYGVLAGQVAVRPPRHWIAVGSCPSAHQPKKTSRLHPAGCSTFNTLTSARSSS